jgi:hypothetical protein
LGFSVRARARPEIDDDLKEAAHLGPDRARHTRDATAETRAAPLHARRATPRRCTAPYAVAPLPAVALTPLLLARSPPAHQVVVFCACAVLCLAVLVMRRACLGYELGGPSSAAIATAVLFVMLWFVYIGASVWYTFR